MSTEKMWESFVGKAFGFKTDTYKMFEVIDKTHILYTEIQVNVSKPKMVSYFIKPSEDLLSVFMTAVPLKSIMAFRLEMIAFIKGLEE